MHVLATKKLWIYHDISVQTSPIHRNVHQQGPAMINRYPWSCRTSSFQTRTSPIGNFILCAQQSDKKLHRWCCYTENAAIRNIVTTQKNAHIIPTNLISTLHILFNLIITYILWLHTIGKHDHDHVTRLFLYFVTLFTFSNFFIFFTYTGIYIFPFFFFFFFCEIHVSHNT